MASWSSRAVLALVLAFLDLTAASASWAVHPASSPARTTAVRTAAASSWSAYHLPGLLQRIDKGSPDAFPDDVNTRDYIAFLVDGITHVCPDLKLPVGPTDFVSYYAFYKWAANVDARSQLGRGNDMSVSAYVYASSDARDQSDPDNPHKFQQAEDDGVLLAQKGCSSPQLAHMWAGIFAIVDKKGSFPPMPPDNRTFASYARPGFKPETAFTDQVSQTALQLFARCDSKTADIPAKFDGERRSHTRWCSCASTHVATAGFDPADLAQVPDMDVNKLSQFAHTHHPRVGADMLDAELDVCSAHT